jgi:hypothetical protein
MAAAVVVVVGWWVGKPLTPELLAVIGVLLSWSVKMDRSWSRRLADHMAAVRSISARRGVADEDVETIYAVLDEEVGREQRRRKQLPGGRSR